MAKCGADKIQKIRKKRQGSGALKKQKFPLLLGPRNRNDMRENNRNDKRNFERRDGKKRDFKGKRDYRDRDRKQEVQQGMRSLQAAW